MKKVRIMVFIIFIAIIIGIFAIKNKKIARPNVDYIATIYHSEMLGMDAGWQYVYYIYPDKNNTYSYIKSESEITIAGASEEKDVELGKIKNENDLSKIEKDIEKNKKEESQEFLHYTYISSSDIKNLKSMDELADCLFMN